jgi:hypothetical protein
MVLLFRIPHKPPAGFLRVLHAPARRGGIRRASKTKINNLGTDEYASNLPFSKIYPNSGGNDGFKKKRKPGIFKNLAQFPTGTMDFKKSKTWNFLKKF